MRLLSLVLSIFTLTSQVQACETALILAIDVSNSVEEPEYRLQVDGLAAALLDPAVSAALIEGQVALMVMQWSGTARQIVTQDWVRMTDLATVTTFAVAAHATPRQFEMSDTAPAEAVWFALTQFAAVADCGRQVIDLSGDGPRNAGGVVTMARDAARVAGVTINAIAIETDDTLVSRFYRQHLITPGGFVMVARGHGDYPAAILAKILRELSAMTG
jgi:Ca-activated chloride channel homolog